MPQYPFYSSLLLHYISVSLSTSASPFWIVKNTIRKLWCHASPPTHHPLRATLPSSVTSSRNKLLPPFLSPHTDSLSFVSSSSKCLFFVLSFFFLSPMHYFVFFCMLLRLFKVQHMVTYQHFKFWQENLRFWKRKAQRLSIHLTTTTTVTSATTTTALAY